MNDQIWLLSDDNDASHCSCTILPTYRILVSKGPFLFDAGKYIMIYFKVCNFLILFTEYVETNCYFSKEYPWYPCQKSSGHIQGALLIDSPFNAVKLCALKIRAQCYIKLYFLRLLFICNPQSWDLKIDWTLLESSYDQLVIVKRVEGKPLVHLFGPTLWGVWDTPLTSHLLKMQQEYATLPWERRRIALNKATFVSIQTSWPPELWTNL